MARPRRRAAVDPDHAADQHAELRRGAPRGFRGADAARLGWPQTPEMIEAAAHRVFDCIESAAKRFHGLPRAGLSCRLRCRRLDGLRIAMNHPEASPAFCRSAGPSPPVTSRSRAWSLRGVCLRSWRSGETADLWSGRRLQGSPPASHGRHLGHAEAIPLRAPTDRADAPRRGSLDHGAGETIASRAR